MQPPEQLQAFGQYLKDRRLQLGKSAQAIAAAADITPQYLWMLEAGKNSKTGRPSRPSQEVLERLARALDVPLADLTGRVGVADGRRDVPRAGAPRGRRAVRAGRRAATVAATVFDDGLLIPPPRLIGRDEELEWALNRLKTGAPPRITALAGMGGIGKTALAAVVFERAREENLFPDGIVVVPCQDELDAVAVLRSVLERFDPEQSEPGSTDPGELERMAKHLLDGRHILVMLDDLEPELDIKAVVTPLQKAGATLLLCARHTFPGALVPASATKVLQPLPGADALELFAQSYGRGSAAELTTLERRGAEAVVAKLRSHTLAVKLAGAHAADVRRDLGALARELEDPRRMMNLPEDDTTPESVELVFLSSMRALPEEAQRLFTALAAFGTEEFGRGAALALAAALGIENPDAGLNLLMRRAMLAAGMNEEMPEGGDRERLQLHPLLQAFAEVQLARWPEEERDVARRAIARYYAGYIGEVEERALAPDDDNVGHAIRRAHELVDHETVMVLCSGMSRFWHDREHVDDSLAFLPWGIEAAEALLGPRPATEPGAAPGAAPGDATTGEMAAWTRRATHLFWLLLNYGSVLSTTGKPGAAAYLERGLALAREARLTHQEGVALTRLGRLAFAQGKVREAEANFRLALDIQRTLGSREREAATLTALGRAAVSRGRLDEAEDRSHQALALAEMERDRRGVGRARALLGEIALRRGRLDAAEAHLGGALEIHREALGTRDEAVALRHLGHVAQLRQRFAEADRSYQQAIERAEAACDRREQGKILAQRGSLASLRGRFDAAESLYRQAQAIAEEVQDRALQGTILSQRGQLALRRGRLDTAEAHVRRAMEMRQEPEDRRGEGFDLALLGQIAEARERPEEAEGYFERALAIDREVQDRRGEGADLSHLGELALKRGDLARAGARLADALGIHREVQDRHGEGMDLALLGRLALARGRRDEAESYSQQARAICHELRDQRIDDLEELVARVAAEIAAAREREGGDPGGGDQEGREGRADGRT